MNEINQFTYSDWPFLRKFKEIGFFLLNLHKNLKTSVFLVT